jgi:hypothetical protein
MSKTTFPSDDELIEIGTKVHDILPDDKKLCRYGVGWSDGSVKDLKTYWCHAALSRAKDLGNAKKKGGPVVISNRIMYKYRPALSKEMIDEYSSFLVNDSVFSECFVNKDMSKLGTQGLIVRTDKPPNMVAAACTTVDKGGGSAKGGRDCVVPSKGNGRRRNKSILYFGPLSYEAVIS